MKRHTALLTLALALSASALAPLTTLAAEKKVAGPNGGRVISGPDVRAEFFISADRKVLITFLDATGNPIPPAQQGVIVTAGNRMNPTKLKFSRLTNSLVSDAPLPSGDAVPTVVQIKAAPGAKTVTARFNADLSRCGECKLAEYACTCDH